MATLNNLMSLSIAIMCINTISFVASEVAQLAIKAQIQNFLMVSLSLSLVFLVLSLVVSQLSSRQTRNET